MATAVTLQGSSQHACNHTCVWLEDSLGRDELKTEKAPLRAGHGALRNS